MVILKGIAALVAARWKMKLILAMLAIIENMKQRVLKVKSLELFGNRV